MPMRDSVLLVMERKGRIDRAVKHSSSRHNNSIIAARKAGAGMCARRKRETERSNNKFPVEVEARGRMPNALANPCASSDICRFQLH
eukprot:scaffold3386_cov128-Skeletonema_menzelii.AAC.2